MLSVSATTAIPPPWKCARSIDAAAAAHRLVRVTDESGEDYLYPADYFVTIKAPEPALQAWAVV
jgi:hypothetical protein